METAPPAEAAAAGVVLVAGAFFAMAFFGFVSTPVEPFAALFARVARIVAVFSRLLESATAFIN